MPLTAVTTPNTFATQSGDVPASELDVNFAAAVSALNTIAQYSTYLVDSGTVNALFVTVPAGLTFTQALGVSLLVQVANTNTGATTLSAGAGAISIVNPDGSALQAGRIAAGGTILVTFNGTAWVLLAGSAAGYSKSGNFGPPTSGDALTVTGASGSYAQLISGSSVSGQSYGLLIEAGTNSTDAAISVVNQATTENQFVVFGDGHFVLGWNGSANTIGGSAAGNVSIAAAASGATLALTAASGGQALKATGQPGFSAQTSVFENLPASTTTTCTFDTTTSPGFSNGSGYSTSTGIFTAPVAGTYLFNATVIIDNSTAGVPVVIGAVYITRNNTNTGTNNRTFLSFPPANDISSYSLPASTSITCTGSTVMVLAAGDTVRVNAIIGAGGTVQNQVGGTFSGYLLG